MALRDLNPRTAAHFDRYLDALVNGERPENGIAGDLAATAIRLQRVGTRGIDHPARQAIEAIPQYVSAVPYALVPRRLSRRTLLHPLHALTAVLMTAVLFGGLVFTLAQHRSSFVANEQERFLYAVNADRTEFVEFDPESLNPAGAVIRQLEPETNEGISHIGYWLLSADGSTLVERELEPNSSAAPVPTAIRVFDTATGQLRSRITTVTDSYAMIGSDGRYLVLDTLLGVSIPSDEGGAYDDGSPDWIVYDTYTGEVVSEIRTPDRAPSIGLQGTLSADGRSLLYLAVPDKSTGPGPWPAILVRFDLATGTELERLELPGVNAGTWSTERMVEVPAGCFSDASGNATGAQQIRVQETFSPGFAVDPTGRQVAIVHADSDMVTLIDLATFSFSATLPLVPDRVATTAIDAACMSETSRSRSAAYSPDGKALFITGNDAVIRDGDRADFVDLGIQRLDLETGVVTSAIDDLPPYTIVVRLLNPLDGDRLIAFVSTYLGRRPNLVPDGTLTLRLYDATSLDLLVEREPPLGFGFAASPVELSPITYVATPEAVSQGAVTLSIGAIGGNVASVQVVADGVAQFHGPLYQGDVTQPITGDHIVVTSSNPGYTVIHRDEQPDTLMLEMRAEYP